MTLPAVSVEHLSKLYRLGAAAPVHDTAVGATLAWFRSPLRNFRNLRRLTRFDDDPRASDVLWALEDVSFDVKEGEVLGIVGRNGAGKSTLLKILSKITRPTAGRAHIRGRLVSLLEVGTGFHPEFTGRENVFLNGTLLGMTRREVSSKFDAIVEFAGVARFIDTPVKRYSSGMYVRLAFSVAAHLEPDILVIDEVLAVGDAEFQAKCLGKMREVSRNEGRTVLFVSHNTGAVRQLCTRALLLESGSIRTTGTPAEVLDLYLRSGGLADRAVTWPAGQGPGNDEIELQGISVNGSTGGTANALTTAEELTVEIRYQVKQAIHNLRVMVTLLTRDGTEVFMTSDFLAQAASRMREPGAYVSQCTIPGGLLNSGSYVIAVDFEIPKTRALLSDQRITFDVPELAVNQLWMSYASRPPGVIHPVLKWEVSRLPADGPVR